MCTFMKGFLLIIMELEVEPGIEGGELRIMGKGERKEDLSQLEVER